MKANNRHCGLQCSKCGRFIGRDGYPRAVFDDWFGGWDFDPLCGPCGRNADTGWNKNDKHTGEERPAQETT